MYGLDRIGVISNPITDSTVIHDISEDFVRRPIRIERRLALVLDVF